MRLLDPLSDSSKHKPLFINQQPAPLLVTSLMLVTVRANLLQLCSCCMNRAHLKHAQTRFLSYTLCCDLSLSQRTAFRLLFWA